MGLVLASYGIRPASFRADSTKASTMVSLTLATNHVCPIFLLADAAAACRSERLPRLPRCQQCARN
jgi:hypothetical protein